MDRLRPLSSPQTTARRRWRLVGLAVCLPLLAWGLYYGFWRAQLKRFQVVRPGVLYRVAQPSEYGFDHLVEQCGVKTVLSLQLFDCKLHKDWCDFGKADGSMETAYVEAKGVRHLQWPMGEEATWPWLTPWQYEEYFKLLDEPENFPIAVHCMGGRHRTGTFAALFRLEYDRWPIEQTLDEMYSFSFGLPSPMQETQLRTYSPRPRPDASEFAVLRLASATLVNPSATLDYESLIYALRQIRSQPTFISAVSDYLQQQRPFALALAQRLIDSPHEKLVEPALVEARRVLQLTDAPAHEWSMAAALVADFGGVADQAQLMDLLRQEIAQPTVSPRYAALVTGVMNRYTPNRLPYLEPILSDRRERVEPAAAKYRYCDTAVARLAVINNQEFFACLPTREIWDDAVETARYWYQHHPQSLQLSTLLPATGRNSVRIGTGREKEDLSRQLK